MVQAIPEGIKILGNIFTTSIIIIFTLVSIAFTMEFIKIKNKQKRKKIIRYSILGIMFLSFITIGFYGYIMQKYIPEIEGKYYYDGDGTCIGNVVKAGINNFSTYCDDVCFYRNEFYECVSGKRYNLQMKKIEKKQPPYGWVKSGLVTKECPESWKSECCNIYNDEMCCPCDMVERCVIECAIFDEEFDNYINNCDCYCKESIVSFCSGFKRERSKN